MRSMAAHGYRTRGWRGLMSGGGQPVLDQGVEVGDVLRHGVLAGERGPDPGFAPSPADPAQELRIQPLEVGLELSGLRPVVPEDAGDAEDPLLLPESLPVLE